MIKIIKKTIFILIGLFLPVTSFAVGYSDYGSTGSGTSDAGAVSGTGASGGTSGVSGMNATEVLAEVTRVIQMIIPIVIGLALLVFLWGILKYLFASDAKNKKEGINYITWGIISLFVMVSIWGLVTLLQQSFLGKSDPSKPPEQQINALEKIPDIEDSNIPASNPILKILKEVADIITLIIPRIIVLGVVVLLWGIFRYAFSSDAKNKEAAKNIIIWGIIALTVMAFLWGFVVILQQTIFKDTDPSAIGEAGTSADQLTQDPTIELPSNQSSGSGINETIIKVMDIVQVSIPVIVTIGIFLFLWGVFKYATTDSAKIKSEGVGFIGWGLILLVTMAGVWGFVKMIGQTAGVSIENQPNVGRNPIDAKSLIKQ